MLRAVASALNDAKPEKQDAGTVALARHYARLIDDAAPAAKYRKALATLHAVVSIEFSEEAAEALDKVRDALAQHSVASDLGPKLLATLTALGLTPAARKAAAKGSNNDGAGTPVNPLDGLRDEVAEQRSKRDGAG
jgi:hypothetical protein